MGTNSEARKSLLEREWEKPQPRCGLSGPSAEARRIQRRREVLRDALAEVWSGADFLDADAVIDHLADRGARIEVA